MVTYSELLDAATSHGISPADIDRVLVSKTTKQDWMEKMEMTDSIETSHYATIDGPAVRVTDGAERFVYVDEQGQEISVEL